MMLVKGSVDLLYMSERIVHLDNWAVALFPELQNPKKRIVALVGHVTISGGRKFLPGSSRIVRVDEDKNTAITETGTQYVLGENSDNTVEELSDLVDYWTRKNSAK